MEYYETVATIILIVFLFKLERSLVIFTEQIKHDKKTRYTNKVES